MNVKLLALLLFSNQAFALSQISEIEVQADYYQQKSYEVAGSLSITDEEAIKTENLNHLEDVIKRTPSLTAAGGSNRARYFQVRGIGERSQYTGVPNHSVGVYIDDIDFSGLAGVASLFDVKQVEVLRGPQGTKFGVNALGGIINIHTKGTEKKSSDVLLTYGNFKTHDIGVAHGSSIGEDKKFAYRASINHKGSDGHMKNSTLNREDTMAQDELSSKLKLSFAPSKTLNFDLNTYYFDIDNGYDAWAIDNGKTTRSDKPGKDQQKSIASALKVKKSYNKFDIHSVTSFGEHDIYYSYDGDWGASPSYDYDSLFDRERQHLSQEIRLKTKENDKLSSVVGVFFNQIKEDLHTKESSGGVPYTDTKSHFKSQSKSIFGNWDFQVTQQSIIGFGLRFENSSVDYNDNAGFNFSPSENLVGGHLTFEYYASEEHMIYSKLARGYKAGGFNLDASLPIERKEYGDETLWNLEIGSKRKWLDSKIESTFVGFYQLRLDQQVKTSFQNDPSNPNSFKFYRDNAAKGFSYGLESETRWHALENLDLFLNFTLMKTEFKEYISGSRDLAGRETSHSPNYKYTLGGEYRFMNGFFFNTQVHGVDNYYYSSSYNHKSQATTLVDTSLGYRKGSFDISLWGKNIFNEYNTVRAFFFDNGNGDTLYKQRGNPRTYGVTAKATF